MTISKQIPVIQKATSYTHRSFYVGNTLIVDYPFALNGYYLENKEAADNSRKIAFCKRPGAMDATFVTGFTNLVAPDTGCRIKGLTTSLDKSLILFYTWSGTVSKSHIFDCTTNTLTSSGDITATFGNDHYHLTTLDEIGYGTNPGTPPNNTNAYAAIGVTNGKGALIGPNGTWYQITDADFTGNGVKTNFVALDGYLFYGVISGTNAGRIYNSDLNTATPTTGWTSTSFLSANDVPGAIIWLSRIRNMLVCFKENSIEFFEDTGNPTPGSPLTPRRNLLKRIGCASASSIQEVEDGIIFMGTTKTGKLSYYKLMRDSLEVKDIADGVMKIALNNWTTISGGYQSWSFDYAVDLINKGQSQIINYAGKELYTTLLAAPNDNKFTYVYDNELGVWVRWVTAFSGEGASSDPYFIPSNSFMANTGTNYITLFVNNYSTNTKSRFSTFVEPDPSILAGAWDAYAWRDMSYYSGTGDPHEDYLNSFVFAWQSDFYDFGTQDRKFLHLFELIYDTHNYGNQVPAAQGTNFNVNLFHFNQDYNYRLSASAGNVCVADSAGRQRLIWRRLGSFRRKAFKFITANAYPMRVWGAEVVYSGGPQYA